MLFEGLSKNIGLRLLELETRYKDDASATQSHITELYKTEKDAMQRVMFKDSFYVLRFVEILTECIKKTHPTLPYILRNQYDNAVEVFVSLKGLDIDAIIDAIKSNPLFENFYRDTLKYIISPLLKRHGLYSPNIVFMMMIDLYMYMLSDYIGYEARDVAREFIRTYVINQTHDTIHEVVWLCDPIKQMMKDELTTWKAMKHVHKKKVPSKL